MRSRSQDHLLRNRNQKHNAPLVSSDKPATAQFGRVSRISGKTMTIDEFIEDQAQSMKAIDISILSSFSDRLFDKLKEGNAVEYPELEEAIHLNTRFLESPVAQKTKDPLPRWMAENGFAAAYLLKRFVLIPDHVAEIGLSDDGLILERVVRRNQSELIPISRMYRIGRRAKTTQLDDALSKRLPMAWSSPPQSTHSVHHLDTFPMHFYRIEFKRVEGNDVISEGPSS